MDTEARLSGFAGAGAAIGQFRRFTFAMSGLRASLLGLTAALMPPWLTLAGLEARAAIHARHAEARVQMRLLLEDATHGLEHPCRFSKWWPILSATPQRR